MAETVTNWILNSLTIDDVATHARIESEGGAGFASAGVRIPNLDGSHLDEDAPYAPLDLVWGVALRGTDSAGAITDPDGEGGHLIDNLSKVKRELSSGSLATLKRAVPHIGTVRALCRLTGRPFSGPSRLIYYFPLVVPSGSWQDDTELDSGAASTSPSVTTDGDKRIHDPNIQFNAAGTLTHTEDDGEAVTVEVTSGPTFPVTVYIAGQNGSGYHYAEDAGSVDVTGDVIFSKGYGLRFAPNSALSLSSTSAVIVRWRNRWA